MVLMGYSSSEGYTWYVVRRDMTPGTVLVGYSSEMKGCTWHSTELMLGMGSKAYASKGVHLALRYLTRRMVLDGYSSTPTLCRWRKVPVCISHNAEFALRMVLVGYSSKPTFVG